MNQIARHSMRVLTGMIGILACVLAPTHLYAQPAGGNFLAGVSLIAQGVPHSDTVPFVLVAFCLILAYMVVCRSANRNPESKLQDLDQM